MTTSTFASTPPPPLVELRFDQFEEVPAPRLDDTTLALQEDLQFAVERGGPIAPFTAEATDSGTYQLTSGWRRFWLLRQLPAAIRPATVPVRLEPLTAIEGDGVPPALRPLAMPARPLAAADVRM